MLKETVLDCCSMCGKAILVNSLCVRPSIKLGENEMRCLGCRDLQMTKHIAMYRSGEEFPFDAYDEWTEDVEGVQDAVEKLEDEGTLEFSGNWFTNSHQDIYDGVIEEHTYHLLQFTPKEMKEIALRLGLQ